MRKVSLFALLIGLAIFSRAQTAGYETEVDVTAGYNFLFSTGDDEYYRSHDDVSEGLLVDRLRFAMVPKAEGHWFDKLSVDFCLANRVDSAKDVEFNFLKHGMYSARIKYSYMYDFFSDPYYNYGNNDRNIARDNLLLDFRWKGVRDFVFNAGYQQVRARDDLAFSTSYWGDLFAVPVLKDNSHRLVKAGVAFDRSGFHLGFEQGWQFIDDHSDYARQTVPGDGFSSRPSALVNPERQTDVSTTIPITNASAGYSADTWSADFRYSYLNGSTDIDVLDLKTFYITSTNSRNDILIKAAGETDLPEQQAELQLAWEPLDQLELAYRLDWQSLESDSGLDLENTLRLYGNSDIPVLESTLATAELFYYKNESITHDLSATVRPVRDLAVTLSYTHTDGNLDNRYSVDGENLTTIDQDYSRDSIGVKGKYRFSFGGEATGGYLHENIDDPAFRTAGDSRDEYQLGFYQPLGNRFNWQIHYRDSRLQDDRIGLANSVKLLDILAEYAPNEWARLGLGYSRFDFNFATGLYFPWSGQPVAEVESYDTEQDGVYFYAGFQGEHRVKGGVSLYFMDDTGDSAPLSRLTGSANVEVALMKNISVSVTGRFFDYTEDFLPQHGYDFQQLVIALRWLVK